MLFANAILSPLTRVYTHHVRALRPPSVCTRFFQIVHVENDAVIRSHSAIQASNLSFVVHGGAKLTVKARDAITFDRSEVC